MVNNKAPRLHRIAQALADLAEQSGAVAVTMGSPGGERYRLDRRPGFASYWARLHRGRRPVPSLGKLGKCIGRGWYPANAKPLTGRPLHLKVVASGRRRRLYYLPGQILPLHQLSVYHGQ